MTAAWWKAAALTNVGAAAIAESKLPVTSDPDFFRRTSSLSSRDFKEFDPVSIGLEANFRLTNFSKLKGWGCKIPQDQLLKLLEGVGSGVGMDCSVIPSKKYPDMFVISTTDFFYPNVEDPYAQVTTNTYMITYVCIIINMIHVS